MASPKSQPKTSLLSIEDQFAFYGSYHTNKVAPTSHQSQRILTPLIQVNIGIHILCVPLIFQTGLILAHHFAHPTLASLTLPALPPLLETPTTLDVNWIFLVALGYAAYFILLEPVAGALYAPVLVGMGHFSNVAYDSHPDAMKYAGWAFGFAWIAQFVGHGAFEGRAPALLTSLIQSLVLAVFFVFLEVLFAAGYKPELHKRVQNKIGVAVAEYRMEKAQKAREKAA
ncbi:hypothetical protein MNV49_005022 [Pseudohyphozyma bogoriensis]|nr:hypothetical protein MNV49_005022 [Pseudohyphozyma bogoriensis]